MNAPQILVGNKKITMPKPKIKLWRQLIKFTEKQQSGELSNEEALDEMIELVVVAFNSPEVTKETVEDNVDFDELTTIFTHMAQQVAAVVKVKTAQFPNAVTPTG
jgi:hypothetical protein